MNNRYVHRQNDTRDRWTLIIYMAFVIILVASLVYTKIKKSLRRRRAQTGEIERIRNKLKSEPPSRHPEKRPQPAANTQIIASGSTSSKTESFLPAPSRPQLKTGKPASRVKDTRHDKNSQAYIQAVIQERQALKAASRQEAIDEAARKARLQAERSKLHLQRLSEKKQLKTQSGTDIHAAETRAPEKTETVKKRETAHQKPLSIHNEAKSGLEKHALYLLSFTFDSNQNAPASHFQRTVKTLAFLYHFHRYNLARRILYSSRDPEIKDAVQLRTLLVHLSNKVNIDADLVMKTQASMREFLHTETARLRQQHTHLWRPTNRIQEALNKLASLPLYTITFACMENLPLTRILYQHGAEIDQLENSCQKVSSSACSLWFQQYAIPFMVEAYRLSTSSSHFSLEGMVYNEFMAAVKMMIILAGEYCPHGKIKNLLAHFDSKDLEEEASRDQIRDYFLLCHKLRNELAHNIFEIGEDELDTLLKLASGISRDPVDIFSFRMQLAPVLTKSPALFPALSAAETDQAVTQAQPAKQDASLAYSDIL
ncbi:hypothetical protein AQUSIP_00800 [Aquicella siphonis]|uniref:Uncharacterized protein n=1 Tax=Aquicella siphonis TaxID=254247 RepID=A0A5E4PEA8_9COXI|nr:hypothetical protein [Aquicella siphonis]VVC74808.1 hypothetical protein AQUSIP_00800 [Aquicella siphonis]